MTTRHLVDSSTILVWGATSGNKTPLYVSQSLTSGGGVTASDMRLLVRDWINATLKDNYLAVYSEECETYRHHESNAGFYEPFHLTHAGAVVLVLPGSSSMGVNTWEVTLLCEENPNNGRPENLEKAIFVCPESLWLYLRSFFASGLDDAMKHVGDPIVALGPANSFLARWISKAAIRTFFRPTGIVPKAPPFHMAVYPDDFNWNPTDAKGAVVCKNLLADLQHELELIL